MVYTFLYIYNAYDSLHMYSTCIQNLNQAIYSYSPCIVVGNNAKVLGEGKALCRCTLARGPFLCFPIGYCVCTHGITETQNQGHKWTINCRL